MTPFEQLITKIFSYGIWGIVEGLIILIVLLAKAPTGMTDYEFKKRIWEAVEGQRRRVRVLKGTPKKYMHQEFLK